MTVSETLFSCSRCANINILDVIGVRWNPLIVLDSYEGKCPFKKFSPSAEGISSDMLTDRLYRPENAGVIDLFPYHRQPLCHCYKLIAKGEDLLAVLHSIVVWGKKYILGTVIQSQQPPLIQY